MMRLFVALAIPDAVTSSLAMIQSGVPGARWQTQEQMHLTLRFIGEVDGRDAAAIDDALSAISAPVLSLQLKGVGEFGGSKPRALWAGVAPNEALLHLQRKVETAMQRIGLEAEPRKFTPHVTLARLRRTPPGAVMDYLVDHALYATAPFETRAFILYESQLGPNGSLYVPQRSYALR
ncbi:MAG TPA: RNA 2',3'-cyclic phosphodiesterase [Rhizomicrobium sp.]|nr:RNA 2',3'-cyclic phosphodiesterase [Rhizomicrobium sp.]